MSEPWEETGTEDAADLEASSPARPAYLGLTREETNWAAVAHAAVVVTILLGVGSAGVTVLLGLAISAVIWYLYRDKSEYVVDQARQATIYQACLVVVTLLGGLVLGASWAVTAGLVTVLVGLCLLPFSVLLTLVVGVAVLGAVIGGPIYGLYAAYEAYHGRPFRYWLLADLIDQQR
jgi:uncharacterized Tic20 family protein